ncbi:MAG: hypothetical protein IPL86_10595 [Flavobacteriales bacterium]|nr:hypothetical protein [Flavobacteriales bacterium]
MNSVSAPAASTPVEIWMKERSTSTFASTSTVAAELTGATMVWSGNVTSGMLVANNWTTVTLTTPFNYTGGANNLEVIILANAGGGGNEGTSAKQFRHSATTVQQSQYWQQDNTAPTGTGSFTTVASLRRLNAQLTIAPGSPCAGTPTPGNTTGPTSSVSGATIALGLQNVTAGSGVTYQWYSSTVSNSGPWTMVGTGLSSYNPAPTVQTWYYCEVTCGSIGGGTGSSAVKQVDITIQTLVPTGGVNNSVSCGTNTALLDHAGNGNYSSGASGYTVLNALGTAVINISGTLFDRSYLRLRLHLQWSGNRRNSSFRFSVQRSR